MVICVVKSFNLHLSNVVCNVYQQLKMAIPPRFTTDSVGGAQLWRPSDQKFDG